jgi:hypothetical protein
MKLTFLLLFWLVFLSQSVISQPFGKPRHVLLIRNNYTSAITKIAENSDITVVTMSGQKFMGRIVQIHADTIFFRDAFVRVIDINTLAVNNTTAMPSMPGPFQHKLQKPGFEYVAGSPEKQVICPPETAYASSWSYHLYVKGLIKEVKRARNEENNPFHESTNPLFGKNNQLRDTAYADSDTGNLLSNAKIHSYRARPMRQYNNFLKWNITKLAHLEISLAYERKIAKQLTWETELSAIFGVQSADAYYTINQPLYNYNGFSVTTYPKYYVISPTTYVSAVFMYRYLWATGIRTDWPDNGEGSSGNGKLQDQYRNDFGLSLRIGLMRRYGNFIVDYYVGGGIKYIMLHQLVYGSYLYHDSGQMHWYNEDHSPIIEDRVLLGPVINAGIKIGFAF